MQRVKVSFCFNYFLVILFILGKYCLNSAAPLCEPRIFSGIYTLRTRQKERHAEKRVFLFGSGGFKAASTLRRLKCSGSAKPPLRNSSLRSQFTPHSRRGPEGPFAYLAAASKVFGQDKKENHPPHHRPCGAGKLSLSSIAMSFQS